MEWYDHQGLEQKWQRRWEKDGMQQEAEDFSSKPKSYLLIEFPYPSGDGLHVGHVRSYTAMDILARQQRLEKKNVLFPIGWDAFGLPTENYALATGIHPRLATDKNIATFRRQLKFLGISFDWSREVDTTDPKYYQWTQWIFLQFFKAGLAYQATIPINWCPKDKIGLANEEVVAGKCERCGTPVTRKLQKQWMLKITAYAERLLKDLDTVDYMEKIKTQQINWIGRSEGAEVVFEIETPDPPDRVGVGSDNGKKSVTVFTTRPDTLFGATFMVLAPEHELVDRITTKEQRRAVAAYRKKIAVKSDLERTDLAKEKTGVFTGAYVVNPVNNEKIPIWIANYVLATYGTGAIMAVPAHDERDWEFAKKYDLPIREVITPRFPPSPRGGVGGVVVNTGEGTMINSGEFDGLPSGKGRKEIVDWLEKKGKGKSAVQYKLRDWVFSRQHYWGEPIPIIHCPEHGAVPVPEDQLPVELPYVEQYQPTGTGESPLAAMTDWVNTTCPICNKPAKRETDTMPNWAGSSWYFLRYTDPKNKKVFADQKNLLYWLPVDMYNGGMEHTTLHLLYSRFWHKFLFDQKLVPTSEPYRHRHSHGIVLGEDGRKMSKSFGNVINPDDLIREYGADSVRLYEMFMGPFEEMIPWASRGIIGVRRFLQDVYRLINEPSSQRPGDLSGGAVNKADLVRWTHTTIQRVTNDIESFRLNTAVSTLMEFVNFLKRSSGLRTESAYDQAIRTLLVLLYPLAPHLTSELWDTLYHTDIRKEPWPTFDPSKTTASIIELIVQVNGKVRARLAVAAKSTEEEVKREALVEPNVRRHLTGEPRKVIFVPNKLINFVV